MKRASESLTDSVYYGFEVSGSAVPLGLLVRNNLTFGNYPDGGPRCDYRQLVVDGGASVTFPQGIRGVWDTFSQSPCFDGGTSCSGSRTRDAGFVPGLGSPYVFVLEPIDCTDLEPATVTP